MTPEKLLPQGESVPMLPSVPGGSASGESSSCAGNKPQTGSFMKPQQLQAGAGADPQSEGDGLVLWHRNRKTRRNLVSVSSSRKTPADPDYLADIHTSLSDDQLMEHHTHQQRAALNNLQSGSSQQHGGLARHSCYKTPL